MTTLQEFLHFGFALYDIGFSFIEHITTPFSVSRKPIGMALADFKTEKIQIRLFHFDKVLRMNHTTPWFQGCGDTD
ncbi:hypothetical protein P1X15_06955 [Runella sp. MFBS21]|uniref:hypothetical protein n=1 Tax=Runella sp. MFBS21 TaxID=3034018 RepID=UPI0023F962A1|nr:hypothetical protein [Runella sp. MFBS21]MDF7817327.1 hypothetical protein [Runella sp. MFBS21]